MSTAALHPGATTRTAGATLRALAAVLAVALLLAAAGWTLRSVHWPISVVRIDGELARTGPEPLEDIVSRHTAGAGFFRLDLDALRADLERLPWVRAASLRRIWPDTLQVVVAEHRPVARWNDDGLVSEHGVVFRPATPPALELPALAGPPGYGRDMLARLRALEHRLQPLGLPVQGLYQDPRRAWRVELGNGITLRLGRGNVDARLARFVAVWPAVLARRAERIEAVDLRYPNGFAVAWRDGTNARAREGGA